MNPHSRWRGRKKVQAYVKRLKIELNPPDRVARGEKGRKNRCRKRGHGGELGEKGTRSRCGRLKGSNEGRETLIQRVAVLHLRERGRGGKSVRLAASSPARGTEGTSGPSSAKHLLFHREPCVAFFAG